MKKIIACLTLSLFALAGCQNNIVSPTKQKQQPQSQAATQGLYDINFKKDFSTTATKEINISINESTYELNNKTLKRYIYTDEKGTPYQAGLPLILSKGQEVRIHVTNNTDVDTNIHWHGLSLPNDQDGPGLLIEKNGGTYDYAFTPDYTGTYWYHSHNRPVRDQVDQGMYGPLVILDPEDKRYTQDKILVLDDWVVDQESGHMQVEGDVDTINGATGTGIEPITLSNEDKVKLRFIQAATAKSSTLHFPFDVLVTHTDGMPLETPRYTNELTLAPGERYDVEMIIDEPESQDFIITNDRDNGFALPVHYTYNKKMSETPKFDETGHSNKTIQIGNKDLATPDITVEMDSEMDRNGHAWTINGEVFPDTESFDLKKGTPYVIRFKNNNHMSNHPMHIHGAHFKVLSQNGKPITDNIWKDTTDVPGNGYTDVLIQFDRVGEWMLHCHILDHEDGGMMTTINVTD